MQRQIAIALLIVVSSLVTITYSTFTHPALLLTTPGLLFGLALIVPRLHPDYRNKISEIKKVIVYSIIGAISLAISLPLLMLTPTYSDKTPYLVIGLIAGLGVSITFDYQFGLKNMPIGLLTIIALSIVALLIGDYFFPTPSDKEMNIGKLIAIWEILVGVGILINMKTQANKT